MDNSINSPRQRLLRGKLKEARKAAKLTQKQLGQLLGKPQSYISKIELGERRVETMELDIILSALGIASEDFLKDLKTQLNNISET